MGNLWVCATEVVRAKDGKEWDTMYCTTSHMDGAVKVAARLAVEVDVRNAWVNAEIDWVLSG